jgi:hypothetical protein
MKTAISIPDSLFKAAEQLARKLGVSRSQLYQMAVARMIAEHDDQATTDALNLVYGQDPALGTLDPVLEELQIRSLPREDW